MNDVSIVLIILAGICLAGSIATNLYTQFLLSRCVDITRWIIDGLLEKEAKHEGTDAD